MVAETVSISHGSTQHIVVHVLGMKHVTARLVPKYRNFLQRECRVKVAKEMLANVSDDPTFIKRIITGDEMWVYEYDVETAQQSSEWRMAFSLITVVWFTINSFQRDKRSIRNTTWLF